MCAEISLIAVNEAMGLVFNNFSQHGRGAFSAGFQPVLQLVLWPLILSAGFALTLLLKCLIAGDPTADQDYTSPGEMQVLSQATAMQHARTTGEHFFITMLHLHHRNIYIFFSLFPI